MRSGVPPPPDIILSHSQIQGRRFRPTQAVRLVQHSPSGYYNPPSSLDHSGDLSINGVVAGVTDPCIQPAICTFISAKRVAYFDSMTMARAATPSISSCGSPNDAIMLVPQLHHLTKRRRLPSLLFLSSSLASCGLIPLTPLLFLQFTFAAFGIPFFSFITFVIDRLRHHVCYTSRCWNCQRSFCGCQCTRTGPRRHL